MRRSRLEVAVRNGDAREVRRLLRAGERPPNEPNVPNLLHSAASGGNVEIARMMLRAGLDIHSQTSERGKYTPLHSAATGNHPEMIDFLLSRGAEIDREAVDGFTPFLSAVFSKSLKAAQQLLERGANLYARARNKRAIQLAKENDDAPMIAWLTKTLDARRWKGVRRMAAPQPYLLAGGHGSEHLDARALKIPPRTTLITLSQCGDVVFKNDTYDNLSHMFAPEKDEPDETTAGRKEFLLNPRDNLFELEEFLEIPRKSMRIHPAGSPCPNLYYNPLALLNKGDYYFMKSGTYRYPINSEDFFDEDGDDFARKEYRPESADDALVAQLFKDSVYPTPHVAREIYKAVKYQDKPFETEVTVHIHDLMTRLGPGTYYFFACRAVQKFPFQKKLWEKARANNAYLPYIGNIVHAADALKDVIPYEERDKEVIGRIKEIRKASQELQNALRKTPKSGGTRRRSQRKGQRRTRKN